MKFVAILCVLSAVCFVGGQDPVAPCDDTTLPSDLYTIMLNSINAVRAKAPILIGRQTTVPPLPLSSQLSHVALWKIADANWGILTCTLENYGYAAYKPQACCANVAGNDCTGLVLTRVTNPVFSESRYSYIGVKDLDTPITEANAFAEITTLLEDPTFNFILGGPGFIPNFADPSPESDKIGIGISDSGNRLALILGDATTNAANYINCLPPTVTPDPGAPCDAMSEPSAVYKNLLAGINEARGKVAIPSPGTGTLPPLPMSSQLSHVALWKIADANWGVVTGCTLPNFGYAFYPPNAARCCGEAGTGDATLCTTKALAGLSTNPISDETSYSYIGAQDLTTPITEANAIEQITLLLADPMFAFILAEAGDNVNSPNPVAPAPIPKTLGIGINAAGNRIALILGNDDKIRGGTGTGYIDCMSPINTSTSTTTINTSTTTTSTTSTTTTLTANTTTTTISTTSGANNFGLGFGTFGVLTAAFFNM